MRTIARGVSLMIFAVWSFSAVAQTQMRSYVSVSGNDVFPCSANKPCRTFAGAETKTAAGGTIIAVDSGEYAPVIVTKSLTIEAPLGVYAAVASTGGASISVAAGVTDTIVLRGLTVSGPGGDGIVGNTFGSLHIEDCSIHGFGDAGITIWRAGKVAIKDTTVRDCGSGIGAGYAFPNLTGTIDVMIEHCRVEGTRIGGAIGAGAGSKVTVRDTTLANNQFGFGVGSAGRYAEITIENSLVTGTRAMTTAPFAGGQGLFAESGAVARISNTVIVDNEIGVLQMPGAIVYTFGNNKIHGNTQDFFGGGSLTPVPQQ
jgi:hypothetical protein